MLSEPNRTAYDINFQTMGFPVRISPFFFVFSLILGYQLAVGSSNPGLVMLLWVAISFASILVHEIGHALAFKRYGIPSRIVLYHFGGLAIPESAFYQRLSPKQQIVISAAGPGIQLCVAALLIGLLVMGNYYIPTDDLLLRFVKPLSGSRDMPYAARYAVWITLFVNVYWAVLNLVPVWPLDGGKISQELFTMFQVRNAIRNSLILSIAACVVLVIWSFRTESRYMGFLFIILGVQSFQLLQRYDRFGGGQW